ncbi:MAG: glycoside hydrolase family 30 beta sandwich domain-containing protein [Paenibacillus sp.]|uniref:glycoside hydrolase family 30 protein n=1 Tax=Paenibacillus sp. TaxID=58172 RepID=UPI00290E1D8C|nr:glycoside hydrolase family 30 beta sandwich domain-containing protein [Paenibacillus sp.]MDU4694202.1 glycoside hydrolase family 30 beta sandwich domain-containing protein [Paenibacillus sp.]
MRELELYYSSGESSLFVRKTEEQLQPQDSAAVEVAVRLDESVSYQVMDGFGASFTDSAAYLIHQVLTEEQRSFLMKNLFDSEEGIGLSVLRNPMGASDYARFIYSYDDLPEGETDPEMRRFSIRHDEADVIPLLKEALSLNPSIKLFGSPWSAPGWMKTSGSMIGGELKREHYEAYANYFVRYVEAYAKHGLSIYAVTPQNEPLYVPGHYPGMLMTAEMQTEFVKDYLKPAFVKHGLSTKILAYDHNWDRPDYPLSVLKEAAEAVDGVAWHWYGGEASAQSQVKETFPEKEVHFTEGSGGEWIPAFEPAFSNVMRTGIEILRNHSQSLVLWNMALDEQNGPTVPGFGRSTCRGIVTVNQQTRELEYTLDYYALAHFSMVIRPGAVRISAEAGEAAVRSVAFRNTDDSIGVVLFNDGEEARTVALELKGTEGTRFRLEPKSALSLRIPRA